MGFFYDAESGRKSRMVILLCETESGRTGLFFYDRGGRDCFVFDTERGMGLFFGDTERVGWDCFPMRGTDCFFYTTERGNRGCFMAQKEGV